MYFGGITTPNVPDAVLLLVLVYVLFRGWQQGAVSQIAALGGLLIGLLVGMWAGPWVGGLVVDKPGRGLALLTLGVLLVAAVIGQGIGVRIGLRLRHAVEGAGMGKLDQVVGVGVGAVGLVLVVWLLSSMLAQGPFPGLAQQIRGSQTIQVLDAALPPPPDVTGRVSRYLDDQGFPQVFAGGGITAPPVSPTTDQAMQAAAAAGQPSTVQIRGFGCGGKISFGSGFVSQPGFVVTNAHVVAASTGCVYGMPPASIRRSRSTSTRYLTSLCCPQMCWRLPSAGPMSRPPAAPRERRSDSLAGSRRWWCSRRRCRAESRLLGVISTGRAARGARSSSSPRPCSKETPADPLSRAPAASAASCSLPIPATAPSGTRLLPNRSVPASRPRSPAIKGLPSAPAASDSFRPLIRSAGSVVRVFLPPQTPGRIKFAATGSRTEGDCFPRWPTMNALSRTHLSTIRCTKAPTAEHLTQSIVVSSMISYRRSKGNASAGRQLA